MRCMCRCQTTSDWLSSWPWESSSRQSRLAKTWSSRGRRLSTRSLLGLTTRFPISSNRPTGWRCSLRTKAKQEVTSFLVSSSSSPLSGSMTSSILIFSSAAVARIDRLAALFVTCLIDWWRNFQDDLGDQFTNKLCYSCTTHLCYTKQ